MKVNIHAAKTTLSRLIAGLEENGGEVLLCRAGTPVVRMTPASRAKRRQGNLLRGEIRISADFDTPDGAIFGITK